ncbi:hypothetical protein ON010_g1581 [Phytophthora cinnamomi]|nr:hypothetical protein ON010_g1581 [Phytophthora cinnamomi]
MLRGVVLSVDIRIGGTEKKELQHGREGHRTGAQHVREHFGAVAAARLQHRRELSGWRGTATPVRALESDTQQGRHDDRRRDPEIDQPPVGHLCRTLEHGGRRRVRAEAGGT